MAVVASKAAIDMYLIQHHVLLIDTVTGIRIPLRICFNKFICMFPMHFLALIKVIKVFPLCLCVLRKR